MLNQSWFGPEPQTMMYPQSRRRPIIFLRLLLCSSQLEPPECVTVQSAVIFVSNCRTLEVLKGPWHPWKADSFNCSLLQRRSLHSERCFLFFFSSSLTNNNAPLPFSPWELRSKPSQRVRLFAVCLCLDSVRASPPFSRSLSKSVTHL